MHDSIDQSKFVSLVFQRSINRGVYYVMQERFEGYIGYSYSDDFRLCRNFAARMDVHRTASDYANEYA